MKARKYGRGIIRPTAEGTFRAEVNHVYKRHRKTVRTEAEARAWIDALTAQIDNQTTPLDVWTLREAAQARTLLPAGVSLLDAARFYVQERGATITPRPLTEAVVAFMAERERAGLRPATLAGYRSHLQRLAAAFPQANVGDLRTPDLIAWLDGLKAIGRTRRGFRASLSAFFTWCMRLGYALRNSARGIPAEIVDEALPAIYTATQTADLMRAAETHDPPLCPFLALGFFAGIRTGEVERLDWSAINGEHVHVGPQAAKRRRQRFVTIMPSLRAWLERYPGKGPISPVKVKARTIRLHRVLERAGLPWPHNVARHSFASYHLALFQDAPRTAHELGHTTPDLLYNHYRNLVTPGNARAYFEIRPESSILCPALS